MKIYSDINDQELIKLLQKGSKDSFHLLYDRYSAKIHHFACSYLKSESDAEELVQDVFVRLWEKRDMLDSSKNIRAYIYKVAVNSIYDFIRKKNIEQAYLDYNGNKQDNPDSTWHEVIYHDMLTQINQLIERMPEQRRKIFQLSKEEGLTNDEIAKTLGLSKRTVENQLYRATAFMKKNLKPDSLLAILFFCLFY